MNLTLFLVNNLHYYLHSECTLFNYFDSVILYFPLLEFKRLRLFDYCFCIFSLVKQYLRFHFQVSFWRDLYLYYMIQNIFIHHWILSTLILQIIHLLQLLKNNLTQYNMHFVLHPGLHLMYWEWTHSLVEAGTWWNLILKWEDSAS